MMPAMPTARVTGHILTLLRILPTSTQLFHQCDYLAMLFEQVSRHPRPFPYVTVPPMPFGLVVTLMKLKRQVSEERIYTFCESLRAMADRMFRIRRHLGSERCTTRQENRSQ